MASKATIYGLRKEIRRIERLIVDIRSQHQHSVSGKERMRLFDLEIVYQYALTMGKIELHELLIKQKREWIKEGF